MCWGPFEFLSYIVQFKSRVSTPSKQVINTQYSTKPQIQIWSQERVKSVQWNQQLESWANLMRNIFGGSAPFVSLDRWNLGLVKKPWPSYMEGKTEPWTKRENSSAVIMDVTVYVVFCSTMRPSPAGTVKGKWVRHWRGLVLKFDIVANFCVDGFQASSSKGTVKYEPEPEKGLRKQFFLSLRILRLDPGCSSAIA